MPSSPHLDLHLSLREHCGVLQCLHNRGVSVGEDVALNADVLRYQRNAHFLLVFLAAEIMDSPPQPRMLLGKD